jgi:RNA polymerase sigma-54 factor
MQLNFSLKQQMQLQITPQMVMTMNLLTLPILDFNMEIEELAQDNPVLEVSNPTEVTATDACERKDSTASEEWDERVLQRIAELGEDPNLGGGSWAGGTAIRDDEWSDPILRLAPTKTLRDDLLEQVRLNFSGKEEEIAKFLVQDLDSRGFLTRTLPELAADVAAYLDKTVSEEEIAAVVAQLKNTLEPPGICAADVAESIALQLRRHRKGRWVEFLVESFRLLRAGKERELQRLCSKEGVDSSFVFEELSKLHLVPTVGVPDDAFDTGGVRPEVLIVKANPDVAGPGKYEVRYNSSALIRLSLNPKIIELARRRDALPPEERQFLREKVQQAKWLKQVRDDRRSMLLMTAEAIVERQWEFLDKGPRYLKALTQREIADAVGRDESTISRLIKGRFAESPQGCIPLSRFFSQAVGSSSGAAAREALREIMDTEKDGQPHTDDELAEMMRRRGFDVQRRTINKYRRMLGGYYALKRSVRRAMNRNGRFD